MTGTIRSTLLAVGVVMGAAVTAQAQPCGTCAPVAPCNTVTRRVMVTEYHQEAYQTTRTVYTTEWKPETYTAYKCELVPDVRTRMVAYTTTVAIPHDVQVTRYECVAVPEERQITRYECVAVPEERQITRYECVAVPEERQITRYECVAVPEERQITRYECVAVPEDRQVTRYETRYVSIPKQVTRCVDAGGHYECREVPCGAAAGSGRKGLFGGGLLHRNKSHGGCECESECAPAMMTVSVYVPNMTTVTETINVQQAVCTPVTETVKVMVNKMVPHPETVKVMVNKTVPHTETVKVMVNKMVSHPETVKVMVNKTVPHTETVKVMVNKMVSHPETINVTSYECKTENKEEQYTVMVQKTTPYTATRQVAVCVPHSEAVTAYRCVPVPVEKEVTYTVAAECGCDTGCGESSYTHGSRRHLLGGLCKGRRGCE